MKRTRNLTIMWSANTYQAAREQLEKLEERIAKANYPLFDYQCLVMYSNMLFLRNNAKHILLEDPHTAFEQSISAHFELDKIEKRIQENLRNERSEI